MCRIQLAWHWTCYCLYLPHYLSLDFLSAGFMSLDFVRQRPSHPEEMKIKSPFRSISRSSCLEKGPQFEELSDSDRCSDIWKVIWITGGPWVSDGW